MASWAYAAIKATLSLGVTKKRAPKIMLRSASPSHAAPNAGRPARQNRRHTS
jgi:hypothetical protein